LAEDGRGDGGDGEGDGRGGESYMKIIKYYFSIDAKDKSNPSLGFISELSYPFDFSHIIKDKDAQKKIDIKEIEQTIRNRINFIYSIFEQMLEIDNNFKNWMASDAYINKIKTNELAIQCIKTSLLISSFVIYSRSLFDDISRYLRILISNQLPESFSRFLEKEKDIKNIDEKLFNICSKHFIFFQEIRGARKQIEHKTFNILITGTEANFHYQLKEKSESKLFENFDLKQFLDINNELDNFLLDILSYLENKLK